MNLGNFMHSSVGFGVYGDAAATLLSLGKGLVTGAVSQISGPVEISSPSELSGAKLTGGFKIIKEGDAYKIVLDAKIPGLSSFTGKIITGKDPIKESLGPLTLEYIPPPTSFIPIIIGIAVVGVAAAFYVMNRGNSAPAARKRKRKSKSKRRKSRRRRR